MAREKLLDINKFSFNKALIVAFTIILIYFLVTIVLGESFLNTVFSDVSSVFINLVVTTILFYAGWRSRVYGRRVQLAWYLLALAQLTVLMGDFFWLIVELFWQKQPFPSEADAFYVLFTPLFILGILLFPRSSLKGRRLIMSLLDMGIVTLSFALIFWIFLIWPTIKNSPDFGIEALLNLYYIVADFLLLFILFDLILNKIKKLEDYSLLLLALGIAVQIIADVIFAYQILQGTYVSGSILDGGWIVSYVIIGLAGFYQATKKPGEELSSVHPPQTESYSVLSFIPLIWVIVTFMLIPWGYYYLDFVNLVILEFGVGFSIFMVVLRQFLSLVENKELYQNAQEEIKFRKEIEKALKESETRYHVTVDSLDDLLYVVDEKFNIVLFNQSFQNWLKDKILENDILGKNLFEIMPFLSKNILTEYKQVFSSGKKLITEKEHFVGSKQYFTETKLIPIFDHGRVQRIVTIIRDISERKKTERRIKERMRISLKHREALLELAKTDISELKNAMKTFTELTSRVLGVGRVSIWFFNKDKTKIILAANYNRLNYPDGKKVLKASDFPNYFQAVENDHHIAAIDAWNDPRTREFRESYLEPLDIYSMLDIPIWLHGELVGILCLEQTGGERKWTNEEKDFGISIAHMISLSLEADEKNRAEKELKNSLKEKDILLKEIHHRVKNNLQIISSLLNLQSRYLTDEESVQVFKESQNRIKSMAIIHEILYVHKNFSKIDMAEYINNITVNLLRSYSIKRSNIKFKINVHNIWLGIDTAIPCGLIINEIITNSLKHAFPNGKGAIGIDMRMMEDDCYNLIIWDDGIGIPPEIDFKNSQTLGLRLIKMLVDQLHGKVELEREDFTCFNIFFKVKKL